MNNTFARELRDRYLAILGTKRDADAQTYLNDAHASRDKMAIPINNCVRNKGRHEGERYVANFGMLPKDVAGVIAVLCYYLANYATLECIKYDGNGDENNKVDIDSNASMNMLRKGLPTMIVNEYNRTLDVSTHHLHAVKNDNGEATTVSDINVACLDKGTYPGHYKVDVNMLVILLGLHNVLPVKKMNQATKSGRLIFQLAGLLGLIENVVAKWLVTNFEEQVHIMVCGSNAGALIGATNNSLIKWRKGPHPENFCAGEGFFGNGNLYSNAKLIKIDEILKEWFIRTLGIIDLPSDDNKQAMEERLKAHEVHVTYRFGNKNLTEEERQQLPSGGKMRRQKAFSDSNSNGCIMLFHLGSNATFAIGNNQTTPKFRSSMWGNKPVGRCHFYELKLSGELSSNLCTLDDGIRLQEKLNEALDDLTDQDVSARLDALSEHGVVGYEVPKEDSTWEKHKRELKSILADNEGSWVNIETDEGDKKVLLLSTGNHGNSTAALYSYVSKHFLNRPIEYLKGLDEWDDISDFNWHLHKSARNKRDEEEEGGAPKAPLDTREKKRQLMRERLRLSIIK